MKDKGLTDKKNLCPCPCFKKMDEDETVEAMIKSQSMQHEALLRQSYSMFKGEYHDRFQKTKPKFRVGDKVHKKKDSEFVVAINSVGNHVYLCDIYDKEGGFKDDYCFYISEQDQWELVEEPTWNEEEDKNVNTELKESGDKKPNGAIVMEDFNDGDGFYKVNLAYLNKEQVEDIEKIVKRWNAIKYDEEAIRACIGIILTDASEQRFLDFNTSLKDCLVWIEEQANHANFRNKIQVGDKVTKNEDGVLVNLSQLSRVAKKDEKQGEKKPTDKVEPRFRVGDTVRCKDDGLEAKVLDVFSNGTILVECDDWTDIVPDNNWIIVEKPNKWNEEVITNYINEKISFLGYTHQDSKKIICKGDLQDALLSAILFGKSIRTHKKGWSKEDESQFTYIKANLEYLQKNDVSYKSKEDQALLNKQIYWLKSLKERVLPKQEWSEEDEEMFKSLKTLLNNASCYSCTEGVDKILFWLKSLSPQNRWKPSEEQMKVLKILVDTSKGFDHSKILESLYNDLKKLK